MGYSTTSTVNKIIKNGIFDTKIIDIYQFLAACEVNPIQFMQKINK